MLLMVLLMVSVLIPFTGTSVGDVTTSMGHTTVSGVRTPHAPILITSNADFVAQSWPGSGNETHPYLIEGLEISSESPCIEIRNISVHYVINDCSLSGARGTDTGALKITDVDVQSRGTISHCDVYNSSVGLYAIADDLIIEENTIWNCSSTDVTISGDRGHFLHNNIHTAGTFSLIWCSTEDSIMTGNSITVVPHTDRYDEVRLYWQDNFTMSDNIFTRARVLTSGTDLLISNNTFFIHDYHPLAVGNAADVIVEGCHFYVDADEMIQPAFFYIYSANNTRVSDCYSDFIKTVIVHSTNVTVTGCEIHQESISVEDIKGLLNISQNHLIGSYYGIRTASGEYTGIISDNIFTGCAIGIWLDGDGFTVRNNTLFNNSLGINAIGDNNRIFYNTFIGNNISAIEYGSNAWDDLVSMGNYWDRYFTVNDRWPVYLDDDAPVIADIGPVTVNVGSNVTLNFTATDNTPLTYSVSLDGVLLENGTWNGSPVTIELTSLSPGVHEVVVEFTDINGNSATQSVIVTCQEVLPVTMIMAGVGVIAVLLVVVVVMKRK